MGQIDSNNIVTIRVNNINWSEFRTRFVDLDLQLLVARILVENDGSLIDTCAPSFDFKPGGMNYVTGNLNLTSTMRSNNKLQKIT